MAGLGVGAAWVQGARPLSSSTITWQELLHRRIRGEFNLVPSGPKTVEAEALLGIDRSSYFYVTRTHPSFGDNSLAFDPELLPPGSVTPFDTGGLAFDHVVTRPALQASDKAGLLSAYTYATDSYEIRMQEWVDAAFLERADYVQGAQPDFSFVPEIDLAACSEQAWTWETRLGLGSGFTRAPDAATRVFLSPGRRGAYLEWLRRQKILDMEEVASHLRRVAKLVVETDSPVDAMVDHLKGLL